MCVGGGGTETCTAAMEQRGELGYPWREIVIVNREVTLLGKEVKLFP